MSTKIHHGFRVNSTSWQEINRHFLGLRSKVDDLILRHAAKRLWDELIYLLDSPLEYQLRVEAGMKHLFGTDGVPLLPTTEEGFYGLWRKAEQLSTHRFKDKDYDEYNACIVLFPMEKYTLGLSYLPRFIDGGFLESDGFVQDWCYFDNTDKPENVSDEEWEQRRIDWRVALDFDRKSDCLYPCVPANAGWTLTYSSPVPHSLFQPAWNKYILDPEFVPSDTKRASNIARNMYVNIGMDDKTDEDRKTTFLWTRLIFDYAYLPEEERKKMIDAIVPRLVSVKSDLFYQKMLERKEHLI